MRSSYDRCRSVSHLGRSERAHRRDRTVGAKGLSCIIARGARFFALAWALRRYGDPIREFIERRLGLLAAIVAGLVILLYIVVKYPGLAGSVTSC